MNVAVPAAASGPASLQAMVAVAFSKLQPHEQQQGHPAKTLELLLMHAPLDAQIWDVLGHALKASRGAGIPPAVGGAPGKQLVVALYTVFCDERGPLAADSAAVEGDEAAVAEAAAKKKAEMLDLWKDMSELLAGGIKMLFSHAEEALGGGADAPSAAPFIK